jgi:hypothetical protein
MNESEHEDSRESEDKLQGLYIIGAMGTGKTEHSTWRKLCEQ